MNTNENARTNAPEEVIVLGVASVETKGPGVGIELAGPGQQMANGISEE
ncbi:benenodin family lasso peptide [Pseudoxanthomonas wuyuanensis]|uniref:Benenodin family lasso peptide n=1 Tax=Pseudoxanthomonas wuyuanensis TaxID=1073196 RepID=A0A286DBR0_9GAMM|nr:benenodin family lasso peptide [Pseudoxanthomonas wuyuanensis]SOD56042.1 hypothetical protein SAMN06296416_108146 [Pseudoxanthomonas wuyuanensis]